MRNSTIARKLEDVEFADLEQQVQDWLAQDPDSVTRTKLQGLIADAKTNTAARAELIDCFKAPLQFGTAGLRGELGPGPNRMNRVTVLKAAAGLGQYLLEQGNSGSAVVIGYDARHNSAVFASDSAQVLAGLGFQTFLFETVVPTPVLAFAIRKLNASAGVMVTASHNPAADNGYKVYLGDGRQIVPPSDTQIAACIAQISDVRLLRRSDVISVVPDSVVTDYVQASANLILRGPVPRADIESVRCVYTAMHGVGWQTFASVMHESGFAAPEAVVAQRDPDPDFPTVKFPNPEEAGALDLATAFAQQCEAHLIVANDPDADRLAIAVPTATGEWKMLRGDQVGVLLGWWVIERARLSGKVLTGAFANSIVSSTLLKDVAQNAGLEYQHTLTGFKWVSRVPNLVFGYEEALGYCVDPDNVSDKDGISAAVLFLELFAHLLGQKKTVWNVLDELAGEFGLHETTQVSVRVADVSRATAVLAKLRSEPITLFGPYVIAKFVDLALGAELPATDGVLIELAPHGDVVWSRVIIRPSGTEPKIKCYLEAVSNQKDLAVAGESINQWLAELAQIAQPLLTGDN
jgi:phosphomannomutase